MLRSSTLARIRNRINENLIQTCTITRSVQDVDAYGAISTVSSSSTTSACYLTRMSRTAPELLNEQDLSRVYYSLHVPHDTDLEDGDVVTIAGETYRTVQVYRSQSVDVMRQAIVVKEGA